MVTPIKPKLNIKYLRTTCAISFEVFADIPEMFAMEKDSWVESRGITWDKDGKKPKLRITTHRTFFIPKMGLHFQLTR
jgi:hypothetical protein